MIRTASVYDQSGEEGTFQIAMLDEATVDVYLEDEQQIQIPVSLFTQTDDGTYRLSTTFDEVQSQADKTIVIPRVEEELTVEKIVVETGQVSIDKVVLQKEELISETLHHNNFEVKRVPINKRVEQTVKPYHDGDTLIFPVYEEVLVTEKHLYLKEELHVTRHRTSEEVSERILLRKEEINVHREE